MTQRGRKQVDIRACLVALFAAIGIFMYGQSSSQRVTGIVTDESGDPLVGVTVLLKGTNTGVSTDIDGNFSLSVPAPAAGKVLEVSYIGFVSQTVTIAGNAPLKIVMIEEAKSLEEVVVIGYGTAKRKDFVGSVSSVRMEDSPIAALSNSNALDALKGAVSGLDVGGSNSAGGTPSMQIRGQNSISGSNAPLLVVDGVIFMGNLNEINPSDIASVDVLKDATSAAVYGSRAANGVICITTKKGRQGKPTISLNLTNGVEMWACKPDLMTAEQWLDATMARNKYTEPSFLTGQQLDNYNNGRSTDWIDLVTRTGYTQEYQAAVSGATEKMNYYMSTAYSDNKGIIKGDDWNRVTIRGRLEATLTDWFKVGTDASYTRSDYSGNRVSLIDAQRVTPYATPYRPNGELEAYPNGTNEAGNPLWGIDDGRVDNANLSHAFRVNAFAEISIPYIKGLSYRLNYSSYMEFVNQSQFIHENYYTYVGPYDDDERYSASTIKNYLTKANGYENEIRNTNYVIDNILTYVNQFGDHNVHFTAVATRDCSKYKLKQITGSNFANIGNTSLGVDGLPFATTQKLARNATRRANVGYLVRGNYNYNNKYFLTGSYRRDGASVFGRNTKWGNFGSVGVAWRISNEGFMQSIDPLDNLKIALSWGRNGNQGVGPYTTLSTIAAGASGDHRVTFGNTGTPVYGISQTTIGNSNLGWETTEAWNVGVETSWFNGRLSGNIDVYFSKTFDQLFSRTIPVMSGFKTMYASMGEVQNRGVEITLRSINVETPDLSWNSSLTFWLNRDKLTRLYGEDLDNDGKEDDDIGNGLFIGESIHSIFGYKQVGIVQESDADYMEKNGVSAGTPKYQDIDGDGKITVADRHIIGNTAPSFKINLGNTLTYKNIQLYAMITGAIGCGGYFQQSNPAAYIIGGNGNHFGVYGIHVPYWTPENKSNKYPAATYTGDSNFKGLQSRSFVRLQDISLSYSFKQDVFRKAGINNFNVFVTGKNLLTFSGWTGGDPELGNSFSSGVYPMMKSVSVGANISF